MGFLDRLVGDLIQESTGLPARRLIRMVGGKNILMAGAGAALAGGLASTMGKNQGGVSAGGPPPAPGSAPRTRGGPPPPPVPGAASGRPGMPPPPPPPGRDGAATGRPVPGAALPPEPGAAPEADAEELPQELTYAIVRTMVAAALADGELAAEEKTAIQRHLGESGLDETQTRQIHQDLVLPPSPEELAALVPAAEAREVMYRFGALISLADHHVSDHEREWLGRLATAFELPAERKAALEAEVFADGQ